VLPSLKTLNAEKVVYLKQGHRAADPVLLLADDGIVGMDLRPGAQNKGGVTSDGKPLVHVLPSGNIGISEKMMGEERSIIDDVFLVTIMKTLVDNPNMTATQVVQLVNERGMLVAPTLGRQFSEYVGGLVEREIDLAIDLDLLEPMPPRLAEAAGRYDVVNTSPLARAARAGSAAGFMRTVETARELVAVSQDMSLLDRFDFDTALPEIAEDQLVPTKWMSSDDQVAAKRKARADAQAQAAAIQAMPAQAAMIKAQAAASKDTQGIV
jgi:hypothetical protein